MTVRVLTPEDKPWVQDIWKTTEADLGSWFVVGARSWHVYWKQPPPRECWIGVFGAAFAHYRKRLRDGACVLDEIAVSPAARRNGHARALLEFMGKPIQLKTDAANAASNAMYRNLGFVLLGSFPAKSDPNRVLNAYLLL